MIDGSFRESFHCVDFFCNQTLPEKAFELIWVEYYDRVSPELDKRINKYSNARLILLGNKGLYHSSYCFNAGIKASKGKLIFIPDADVAVEPFFLEQAAEEHKRNEKLVMYFYRGEEPQDKHQPKAELSHLKEVCKLVNPSNYGGCISVRKKWFLEINGYEQHPVFGSGFHANGLDLYTRFKNLGLHIMWHPRLLLYHPWHPLNAAGFPVWEVQKTIVNYRALALTYLAFQGIDPVKNREMPSELTENLNQAKKKYKLEEVFDAWYNLKIDPERTKQKLFYRPKTGRTQQK